MSKLKKVIGDVDVNKGLLFLLTIGGLYSLGIALSNTFVNVYLWKQSGKFIDLAIYNLSIVTMQPITFYLAGRLAKKIDRVFILRFGVIFFSCLLFKCAFSRRNGGQPPRANRRGARSWLWLLLASV